MFEPLPAKFDFPQAEKRVLAFWKEQGIFDRSLEQRAGTPRFVFYEGPPTANGLPHPGHCLTRAIKDLFPRYQTMCGKLVERKAGWDTHGLPVEVEVCKELGIHAKEQIEQYGLEPFVHKCVESVWRYMREWEEMTDRLGFWIKLDQAYATYHQTYVESVWWGLKTLFERGLLYQGHKVVWWWAQGGTALSAGEVGEGYRAIDDPSVFVKFPLLEGYALPNVPISDLGRIANRCSLLVWTTTPWTLVSNHFAAVHPEVEYALIEDSGADNEEPEYLYVAKDLVESVSKKVKRDLKVVATCKGADLVRLRYWPPFMVFYDQTFGGIRDGERTHRLKDGTDAYVGWRVLPADFVTIENGTGLVHEAPAFGEVDFDLFQKVRGEFVEPGALRLVCAVGPDGRFNMWAPEQFRGRFIFDCDKEIIRELRDERKTPWGSPLLFHQELYRHDYPFCPRAEEDKLIQYARKSWFVRTSQFKDEFLANNAQINWLPEHIKQGRFGDFLRNNVDWALSRERYWGTPLPIWVCEQTGKMEAIGSYDELLAKPGVTGMEVWEQARARKPDLPDDLKVHRPYIDAITYDSPFVEERAEGSSQKGLRDSGIEGSSGPSEIRNPHSGIPEGGTAVSAVIPRMRRVPEVIDCWWDAGSMPFAQWGFPHAEGSIEQFSNRFPASFISEAIDQTRGWFYGLLAISTLLFSEHANEHGWAGGRKDSGVLDGVSLTYPMPYRTCIVLGHMMGEDGTKMSKRLKNYKEPGYIFDRYGADAMRWFFFSAQTPWTSVRFQENAIRDAQREFLVRLYNVFSFFNIYANIDGFNSGSGGTQSSALREAGTPGSVVAQGGALRSPNTRLSELGTSSHALAALSALGLETVGDLLNLSESALLRLRTCFATGWRPVPQRSELDRWILSELHLTIRAVREALDRFENFPAAQRLNHFVDALSNWYVRRSRDRFWRAVRGSGFGVQGSEGTKGPEALSPQPSALSTQHSGLGTRDSGLGTRDSELRTQHSELGTQHSELGTQHSALGTRHSELDQQKWDAYNTLYECLVTLSKLIAPFTPFFAETMYRNLKGLKEAGIEGLSDSGTQGSEDQSAIRNPQSDIPPGATAVSAVLDPISVHLCDYPTPDEALIDESLADEMELVRDIASLGRAARTAAKLKVRQPLAQVEIILADQKRERWLRSHAALIADELNVKNVEFTSEADHYVRYEVKPNFKSIGPKHGKLAPKIAAVLKQLDDPTTARKTLVSEGRLSIEVAGQTVELTPDEVEIRLEAKPGWSAVQGRAGVVVLNTDLTDDLRAEGLIRELIHHVQNLRKEHDLAYEARITLCIAAADQFAGVVQRFQHELKTEVLADALEHQIPAGVEPTSVRIEGHEVRLAIRA